MLSHLWMGVIAVGSAIQTVQDWRSYSDLARTIRAVAFVDSFAFLAVFGIRYLSPWASPSWDDLLLQFSMVLCCTILFDDAVKSTEELRSAGDDNTRKTLRKRLLIDVGIILSCLLVWSV